MFETNKKQAVNTPSNFGADFIHTMSDDLNPSSSSISDNIQSLKSDSPFASSSQDYISDLTIKKTESSISKDGLKPVTNNTFIEKGVNISKKSTQSSITIPPLKQDKIYADSKNPSKKNLKPILIILFIFIIILLIGGGYYAWKSNILNTEIVDEIVVETKSNELLPATESDPIIISPLSEKYLTDKPNYLAIDIESSSADDIKNKIIEISNEMGEVYSQQPLEFIITDLNNNPIAFHIFSTLASLNLSPILLENFEEHFSIYVYRDMGKTRTGITIEIKNEKEALSEMIASEKNLIDSFSFLLLSSDFIKKDVPFSKNTYSGIDSRYINLDSDSTTSIDYGVYENNLIIATSKNTFRSIIDKMIINKELPLDTNMNIISN